MSTLGNCYNAYRALVKMVNALALVYGEKDYTAFIDYANTEITHYKREVLNQKASAPSTSGSSAVDSGSSSTPSGGGSSSGKALLQAVVLRLVEVHRRVVTMEL